MQNFLTKRIFSVGEEYMSLKIPVTPQLHDIEEKGRIREDEFVDEVESILGEYNLS